MKVDLTVSFDWEHLSIEQIEQKYNAKFVCETCIKNKNGGWRPGSSLIFYSEEKHPEGSNYFAFSYDFKQDAYVVSDAISVVGIDITGIIDGDKIIYSRFGHDYRIGETGVMIDGGRGYLRSSGGQYATLRIEDGELKIIEIHPLKAEEDEYSSEPCTIHTVEPEVKITPANGIEGVIIRVFTDPPTHMFRVYNKEDCTFKDYDILHFDVGVTITDEGASLYESNGICYLDYSPEAYGK